MESSNNKIAVKSLIKSYPFDDKQQLKVLDKISFTVEEGEFCSILGPSGCGKTTLLKIIAGIEPSDSGSIEISSPPQKSANLSFVSQQKDLLPWLPILSYSSATGLRR